MKTVAIIQARMGSSRLPGKVMMKLGVQTVLSHVITRVKKAHGIDEIAVATTNQVQDDVIQQEADKMNVVCFRGSETDVLERYYQAAKQYDADIVIRITSDCPFLDPNLLTKMVRAFHDTYRIGTPIDYFSNCLVRTYPRGLDIEIFTMMALEKAYRESISDYQKEHVTPYIYQNTELFNLQHYTNPDDISDHRWTLDTIEDFIFISHVYEKLSNVKNDFTTDDILALMQKEPELLKINSHVKQKAILS